MKSQAILLAISLLTIGQQAMGQVMLDKNFNKPVELTEAKCDERRILRLNQLWRFYWARNDKNKYTQVRGGKTYQESTKILAANAVDLQGLLKAEVAKTRSTEAQSNLNYLNNNVINKPTNCWTFAKSQKQFNDEFKENFGPLPMVRSVGLTEDDEVQPVIAKAPVPTSHEIPRQHVQVIVHVVDETTTGAAR